MTAFCKDRPSVKKHICQYDLDWNQEKYCKSGNVRDNKIIPNRVKRTACDVKNSRLGQYQ